MENVLSSFFPSFFLTSPLFPSSLCTFHGVQVSQRLLITGSLPRYSWSYSRALTFSSDLCVRVCSIAFSIPMWTIACKCIWSIFFFFYLVSQRIFFFFFANRDIYLLCHRMSLFLFFFFSRRESRGSILKDRMFQCVGWDRSSWI